VDDPGASSSLDLLSPQNCRLISYFSGAPFGVGGALYLFFLMGLQLLVFPKGKDYVYHLSSWFFAPFSSLFPFSMSAMRAIPFSQILSLQTLPVPRVGRLAFSPLLLIRFVRCDPSLWHLFFLSVPSFFSDFLSAR